jgi:protein required for attachment to host cells
MSASPHVQFVIADGSRARWVRRSERADDFVTVRELKAEPPTPGEPDGVVFGSSGQRFNVSEKDAAMQRLRTRFAEDVAEALNAEAGRDPSEKIVVVAPERMLEAIQERLSGPARSRVIHTLAKDLTKTPDHELGRWLEPLERG